MYTTFYSCYRVVRESTSIPNQYSDVVSYIFAGSLGDNMNRQGSNSRGYNDKRPRDKQLGHRYKGDGGQGQIQGRPRTSHQLVPIREPTFYIGGGNGVTL